MFLIMSGHLDFVLILVYSVERVQAQGKTWHLSSTCIEHKLDNYIPWFCFPDAIYHGCYLFPCLLYIPFYCAWTGGLERLVRLMIVEKGCSLIKFCKIFMLDLMVRLPQMYFVNYVNELERFYGASETHLCV
jgi:hypothetical protein